MPEGGETESNINNNKAMRIESSRNINAATT